MHQTDVGPDDVLVRAEIDQLVVHIFAGRKLNRESGVTKVAGKYIVIWKRSGHTWQLYRDIWNTD